MYSAVVRGRIGEEGPVVSRAMHFDVTFLCITDKFENVTQPPNPYLVFDLNRKKR